MPAPLSNDHADSLAKSIAGVRAAVGVTCLFAPSLARVWVGPEGGRAPGRVLSRSLAARDIALGYGTVRSRGAVLRKWALLSALSDAADAVGTVMAYGDLPRLRRAAVALVSAAAAGAGVLAAASLPSQG